MSDKINKKIFKVLLFIVFLVILYLMVNRKNQVREGFTVNSYNEGELLMKIFEKILEDGGLTIGSISARAPGKASLCLRSTKREEANTSARTGLQTNLSSIELTENITIFDNFDEMKTKIKKYVSNELYFTNKSSDHKIINVFSENESREFKHGEPYHMGTEYSSCVGYAAIMEINWEGNEYTSDDILFTALKAAVKRLQYLQNQLARSDLTDIGFDIDNIIENNINLSGPQERIFTAMREFYKSDIPIPTPLEYQGYINKVANGCANDSYLTEEECQRLGDLVNSQDPGILGIEIQDKTNVKKAITKGTHDRWKNGETMVVKSDNDYYPRGCSIRDDSNYGGLYYSNTEIDSEKAKNYLDSLHLVCGPNILTNYATEVEKYIDEYTSDKADKIELEGRAEQGGLDSNMKKVTVYLNTLIKGKLLFGNTNELIKTPLNIKGFIWDCNNRYRKLGEAPPQSPLSEQECKDFTEAESGVKKGAWDWINGITSLTDAKKSQYIHYRLNANGELDVKDEDFKWKGKKTNKKIIPGCVHTYDNDSGVWYNDNPDKYTAGYSKHSILCKESQSLKESINFNDLITAAGSDHIESILFTKLKELKENTEVDDDQNIINNNIEKLVLRQRGIVYANVLLKANDLNLGSTVINKLVEITNDNYSIIVTPASISGTIKTIIDEIIKLYEGETANENIITTNINVLIKTEIDSVEKEVIANLKSQVDNLASEANSKYDAIKGHETTINNKFDLIEDTDDEYSNAENIKNSITEIVTDGTAYDRVVRDQQALFVVPSITFEEAQTYLEIAKENYQFVDNKLTEIITKNTELDNLIETKEQRIADETQMFTRAKTIHGFS
jgi:hypothetical protein